MWFYRLTRASTCLHWQERCPTMMSWMPLQKASLSFCASTATLNEVFSWSCSSCWLLTWRTSSRSSFQRGTEIRSKLHRRSGWRGQRFSTFLMLRTAMMGTKYSLEEAECKRPFKFSCPPQPFWSDARLLGLHRPDLDQNCWERGVKLPYVIFL